MYERAVGMGDWSTVSWVDRWFANFRGRRSGCNCGTLGGLVQYGNRTHSVCFEDTPQDIALAALHGCSRGHYKGGRQVRCNLDNGREGLCWCCPPGYPRPYERGIPHEVDLYQRTREQHLEEPPPDILSPGDRPVPRPVHTMPLLQKLIHPGSIMAFGVIGLSAWLYFKHREVS